MEKEQSKFSILMFPWLAHGHIFPFLELAKKLSKRNFHIYFCSTAVNLESIKNSNENLSCDVSIELVELQLPPLPELPPQFHTTKNLPPNLWPTLLQTFQKSSTSFSNIINTLRPDLLIYDFLQPWAPKLALSQGIPSVFFAVAGATTGSFSHHMLTKGISIPFPYQEIYILNHEMKIDLFSCFEANKKNSADDFFAGHLKLSSDIVLVKSCRGFEGKYIDYYSVLCEKEVVPTGPLVEDANHDDADDDEEHLNIMQWLSEKDKYSTVYISFGSECFLSKEQIEEIAKGLELCYANFIWVIRFPVGENTFNIEDALPKGFYGRVKERGRVVQGWAPQAKILSHPSVGGFVSHCGWSSIVESMYCGVPIIAMPMQYDQPINARLVVGEGTGIEVGKDKNGVFLGQELAKVINKVLNENTFCEGLMCKAKELSKMMKDEEEEAINETTQKLLKICKKNKKQE